MAPRPPRHLSSEVGVLQGRPGEAGTVSECTQLTLYPGTWHVAHEGCSAVRALQSCRGFSGHGVLPEAACVVEKLVCSSSFSH